MNQEKIALLKEMYQKYDFTSAEQNLLEEMFEAWGGKYLATLDWRIRDERDSF